MKLPDESIVRAVAFKRCVASARLRGVASARLRDLRLSARVAPRRQRAPEV
jgi:hypothetical protein